MAGIKDIAKGRSDLYRVSPFDLNVKEGWNSREDDNPENQEHIDRLASSIAEVGVKEPLTVYLEDGKLFIENGHCRRAAAIKAIEDLGADREMVVPVRMSEKESTEADRILSQIIRNSGKPLSPLEMASVFKRLRKLDLSDGEIAKRAGVSRVYVGQLIALSEMPKSVTEKVRSGSVSATLAIEVMKANDGDGKKTAADLKEAVKTAKSAGKTRATKKHVKPKEDADPDAGEEKPKRVRTSGSSGSSDTLKAIREIVEGGITAGSGDRIAVSFERAEYDRLIALLGTEQDKPSAREDDKEDLV